MLISYPSELGRLERSDLGPEFKSRIKIPELSPGMGRVI